MGYPTVTPEIINERLTMAYRLVRKGGKLTTSLGEASLDFGTFSYLHKTGYLSIIHKNGRSTIYDFPDPDTEDGRERIRIQAQELHDNFKKRKPGKEIPRPTQLTGVSTPPLVAPNERAELIELLARALMQLKAPLGKSAPEQLVAKNHQLEIIVREQKDKILSLESDLAVYDKMMGKVAERKGFVRKDEANENSEA